MSLSKKDFIALADATRILLRHDADKGLVSEGALVDMLVQFCREQNPRFDEERWRGYLAGTCGPSGGVLRRAG